jgi:twitching motility protein PilT
MQTVLDQGDCLDTLMGFRHRAEIADSVPLDLTGCFSFGVKGVGRIRVNYATQRGSKILTIVRVPFTIPELKAVCSEEAAANALLRIVDQSRRGVLTISGPSAIDNSLLAYALLRRINDTERCVICIVERILTFLMAHNNSIVVQTELSTDALSLDEGVRSSFAYVPNVLYVGDVYPEDRLVSVHHAIRSGAFALLTSVAVDGQEMIQRLEPLRAEYDEAADLVIRRCSVRPAPGSKLQVKVLAD